MVILRRDFGARGIVINDDSTPENEEVCCDLSVGDSYMEAGRTEAHSLAKPLALKPGACIILRTAEQVVVPNNVFGLLCSKGSLAARGLLVPNTKIDPLFSDTLEIAVYNAGQRVLTIDPGMKFCSIVFHELCASTRSTTPRNGPRISNIKTNKWADFFAQNGVHVIGWIATIVISVLGGYFAGK